HRSTVVPNEFSRSAIEAAESKPPMEKTELVIISSDAHSLGLENVHRQVLEVQDTITLDERVHQQRPFFEGKSLSPAQRCNTRFAKNDAGSAVLSQYLLKRFRGFAQVVENRLARMSKAGAHNLPQKLFILHFGNDLLSHPQTHDTAPD